MKRLVVGLLFLLGATDAHAARLEPAEPQLGERAVLRLEAAPVDSTENPTGNGVALRATPTPTVFTVVPVRVGEVAIAIPARQDTLRWTVQPRLAQAAPDSLRPLARVGEIGPTWWPYVAALVALLALLLVWWMRRRGTAEVAPAFELPTEPPHEVALRRLDQILASGWIPAGRFDEVYVEASHALRGYVGGRFRVPALDWTTSETVERLIAVGYERETVAPVDPLLRAADAVKFAAQRPSEHQAEQWIAEARSWIEHTAVPVVHSTPEAVRAARELHGGKPS